MTITIDLDTPQTKDPRTVDRTRLVSCVFGEDGSLRASFVDEMDNGDGTWTRVGIREDCGKHAASDHRWLHDGHRGRASGRPVTGRHRVGELTTALHARCAGYGAQDQEAASRSAAQK